MNPAKDLPASMAPAALRVMEPMATDLPDSELIYAVPLATGGLVMRALSIDCV